MYLSLEKKKSHSLIFLQNFMESTIFITLAQSETNLTPAKLYGLTWEAIKRTSSKHPTKLSRTPLYSHMSSIKACSSRLNQVLIDVLYSWYVHSILLLHSFYTSLARRGQFPPNPKHHLFHIFCLYIYIYICILDIKFSLLLKLKQLALPLCRRISLFFKFFSFFLVEHATPWEVNLRSYLFFFNTR